MADENARLRQELKHAFRINTLAEEERQEILRLRAMLDLPPLRTSPAFAARVIASRLGPQSVLQTLTVNKGFVNGAIVGTPVIVPSGVVGKVMRASPHTATVLLVSDPGFRVAVISQQTRTPGIVTGTSTSDSTLEVHYVAQNARIQEGELLITAGVDGLFPKGIPVGLVTRVLPGHETLFQQVHAVPFVPLQEVEEVLLLQPVGSGETLLPPFVGPPEPLFFDEPETHLPIPLTPPKTTELRQ